MSALTDTPEPGQPALPTYRTAADVLEKQKGSGWALAGWTVARTVLIFPPFLLVGVPWKRALAGSMIASGLISLLTLFRVGKAVPLGATRHPRARLAGGRSKRR